MIMLKVESVTKRFGGLVALRNVSMSVNKNEIFGIIGPNGSGKTTLFNVISGVLRPDEGKVIFEDKDITHMRPSDRVKLGIARTFQTIRVFPYMPVYWNVMVTASSVYSDSRIAKARVSWALTITGLLGEAGELAGKLTPYKLKMLEFARCLVANPKLIMLDEPFAGLSPEEIERLISIILKLRENGLTFIIIEHKLKYLMRIANRIMALSLGEKVAEGKPDEVARHPKVIEAYIGVT